MAPDTNAPPARDTGAPPITTPDAAITCVGATHLCGQRCLRDDDPDSCGDRCDPCPRPSPGSVACVQGRCQITCPDGYHLCFASRCASNTSVQSCGFNCDPCLDVENGDATCDGRVCDTRCRAGFLTCREVIAGNERVSACAPPTIGFESGTAENFFLSPSSIGVDAPVPSTKMAHSGSYSLAQAIRAHAESENSGGVCRGGGGAFNAIGKTVSLWYYFDRADPPPGARILLGVSGADAGTSFSAGLGDWPLMGQRWTKITSAPIDYPSASHTRRVEFGLNAQQAPAGYTATLYVDDIAVE